MALSEREYMGARGRAFQSRFALTTTRILVAANAVAFFFQELAGGIGGEGAVMSYLPLSQSAISHGALWTFVTYSFLHDNLFHLLANMLTLWCTGNFLEPAESRSRILVLYFGGVLAGAFLWYPVGGQARLIGASAGVCATMAYMLLRHFHDTFRLLLPPIVMRAKWMLAFLTVITLSGFLFAEIPTAFPSSWWPALWKNETAHSAHLGGLLWGTGIFALGRWFFSHRAKQRKRIIPFRQVVSVRHVSRNVIVPPSPRLPPHPPAPPCSPTQVSRDVAYNIPEKVFKQNSSSVPVPCASMPRPAKSAEIPAEHLEAEVNRILDKINVSGFISLSAAERALLAHASTLFAGKK